MYAFIIALGVAFGVWLVIRPGPTLFFGRPFGLRVTAEGIEERDEWGAHTSVAWSEIRLFEVLGGQFLKPAIAGFAVYTPDKRIFWRPVYLMTERLPIGATPIEQTQRLAALVSLVTARTGLEPRTLDLALQRGS
ncbi:MAG TPA: hypothetical protein VF808_06180 [Ktedonobacterales bacterium]